MSGAIKSETSRKLRPRERVVPEGSQYAQQAAVKGHAPVPDAQNFQRVVKVYGQIVKQHITQTAAQNNAHHDAGEQVVHIGGGPAGPGLCGAAAAQNPAQGKARQIHEAVPVYGKGADGKRDRIG